MRRKLRAKTMPSDRLSLKRTSRKSNMHSSFSWTIKPRFSSLKNTPRNTIIDKLKEKLIEKVNQKKIEIETTQKAQKIVTNLRTALILKVQETIKEHNRLSIITDKNKKEN